ncbi:ABC transporter gloK [Beauveria bassiana]|nr:ABC transporter gloK [Beauveria bassiana]
MLAIVPGGVVALMVPFYLQTALRSPRQVRSGRLLWLKLAIGIILLAVQTSNLVGWHAASLFRSKLALPAAAMSLLASVGIVIILCVAHTYSLQPSTFLGVFMSLTIIFDIAMACSCFRGHGFDTTGAISSYAIILKLTIVILEQVSKRNLFRTKKSRCTVSREGAAGFWNRATFTWLYPLLTAGFGKELSRDDLPQIGQDFDCLQNFDKFFPIWERAAFNNSATPVLVLGGAYFWTRSGESLSAAEVFTILAIVAIVSEPLTPFLQGIMEWTVGSTSLGRIQNFLVSTEAEDARQEGEWQLQTVGPAADDKSDAVPKVSMFAVQVTVMGFTSLMQGPILRNINMQAPWGSLAIIWGPINCGKSTLLKTIVGESEITTGTVNVGTKLIAYCGQQPWIPNQTVRNVVIGVCDFLEERYNEVIYCCALDMDILHMPQGDQTMTGIAGCNLSGGQKQRLSLARAVYDELEVLVLDDVLSSLDALTAETIMSRLFGVNGLLRRLGRTVVMTTNRLEFLDYASLVYEMDMKGHIQLEARGESDDSASTSSATTSIVSESEAYALCAAAPKPTEPPSVQPLEDDTELKDARMPRRTGTWSLYTYYLLPAGLFWVVSWVFIMAIAAAIEKMPRKSTRNFWSARKLMLNPVVFVRVWYSRDRNNFYYFIGFALFAVASIFCNTVMGMYVYRHWSSVLL